MSKKHKGSKAVVSVPAQPVAVQQAAAIVAVVAPQPAAAPAPATLYRVIAPKRPLTGTKFGAAGNLATHTALCEAATKAGGSLTMAQLQAVCAEQHHKGFLQYAINRLKVVVPVVEPQPPAVA